MLKLELWARDRSGGSDGGEIMTVGLGWQPVNVLRLWIYIKDWS